MNWWMPHNFEQKKDNLLRRSVIIKALRHYFDAQDFAEVDTPTLQICPVMDVHIHGFITMYKPVDKSGDKVVLSAGNNKVFHNGKFRAMALCLLTAGMERIYQICHAYRNGEQTKRHSPEFTIMEWYRVGKDYTALMDDCEDVLRRVAQAVGIMHYRYNDISCDPFLALERLSVAEAFTKYAQIDITEILEDRDEFAAKAQNIGVRVVDGDAWDDIFHAVMAEKIEPFLGHKRPSVIYDYPVSMAVLSRRKVSDPRFAERFELYVCGVELANAFSELTDAVEQRKRYEADMALKKQIYGESYPPDEEFFAALAYGMPESAGIALGVDRLIMLACNIDDIAMVQWAECPIH